MNKKNYKELYRQTKKLYFEINNVYCPALNNEKILFNSPGWRHLIWKGKEVRPMEDRLRRFKILKYAEQVLNDGQIIHYGEDVKNGVTGKFWKLRTKIDKRYMKVIVRQLGNGQKHFFSIMN